MWLQILLSCVVLVLWTFRVRWLLNSRNILLAHWVACIRWNKTSSTTAVIVIINKTTIVVVTLVRVLREVFRRRLCIRLLRRRGSGRRRRYVLGILGHKRRRFGRTIGSCTHDTWCCTWWWRWCEGTWGIVVVVVGRRVVGWLCYLLSRIEPRRSVFVDMTIRSIHKYFFVFFDTTSDGGIHGACVVIRRGWL